MSVGSIGSTSSFWQQDQSYWNQAQSRENSIAATNSVISAMQSAETNLGKGLASIANGQALQRVNSQLVSAVQSVLEGGSGSSSAAKTSSSSSSSSSASTGTPAKPATGVGTVVMTTGTTLSSLGILPGGTITISAGSHATTYTSTGSDTVANLISAINVDLPTNAQVSASLNTAGKLVLTSRNTKDSIAIVGSGTDASVIGFGVGHSGFEPTKATGSAAAAPNSSNSSTTSTKTTSNSNSTTNTTAVRAPNPLVALTQQNLSQAASILSDSGVGGTLVDMLT